MKVNICLNKLAIAQNKDNSVIQKFIMTYALSNFKKLYKNIRQWLFRRRRQFALGIYFAVIIHVCLYSQICYNNTSDTVV